MNFVCTVFEQGDEMLTLLSMEKTMVECNQMKAYSDGPGHMTRMATMPLYGTITFSETKRLMTLKVGMLHWMFEKYQVCSNDDPELTLAYFTARSHLVPYAFVWLKGKQWIFQKLL